jgi:putative oxidoreductase
MKKIFLNLIQSPFPTLWSQNLVLAIPRVFYGYLLAVMFGAPKFGMPWSDPEKKLGLFEVAFWFPDDVSAFGGIFALFPAFWAWMAAFSEAVGGIFWIFGLGTKPISFLVFCTMFVAAFFQQMSNGIWNMLPSLGILFISLFYLVFGPGKFSLDYLITNKFNS